MCEYCHEENNKKGLVGGDGIIKDPVNGKHYLYIERFHNEVCLIEVDFCPKCGRTLEEDGEEENPYTDLEDIADLGVMTELEKDLLRGESLHYIRSNDKVFGKIARTVAQLLNELDETAGSK